MKYTDLKDKSINELLDMLKASRLELFGLRVKKTTMQLQKTSDIRNVKKSIARILTAINAKKVGE